MHAISSDRAAVAVSVLAILWTFAIVCVIGTMADPEEREDEPCQK